jgi:hypothetical protein
MPDRAADLAVGLVMKSGHGRRQAIVVVVPEVCCRKRIQTLTPYDSPAPGGALLERVKTGTEKFTRQKWRFTILFLMIVGLILLAPAVPHLPMADFIFPILGALIPLAAIHAVSDDPRHMRNGLILGIPATLAGGLQLTEIGFTGEWLILLLPPLFYGYTVYVVAVRVFTTRRITPDLLSGAACIYLLLGMTWWFFYLLLETFSPGAIGGGPMGIEAPEQRFELLYFSFVTLTTLGYGDMLPTTPGAKAFTIIEAVTGVLYSGILIAKLVGAYAGQARAQDD